MTAKHRIQLEQSKLRETINSAARSARNDERTAKRTDGGNRRGTALEPELRAAIIAEPEVTESQKDVDSEARERLELRSKSKVVNYVKVRSRCGQFQVQRPSTILLLEWVPISSRWNYWHPLRSGRPRTQDTSTNQGTWLDRLVRPGGCSVPWSHLYQCRACWVSSHPVTTAGAGAEQQAKSEAASAAAWTIGVVPN